MADNDSLVLRLDGPDAASAGPPARMAFGPDGGTIGSGQDSWVLSDPQGAVEEHHARIMFVARRYFIADTSSKGVFVADDASPLGPGASAQLSAGDRLRIGPYRIVVEQAPGTSAATRASARPGPPPAPPVSAPGPESLFTAPNTIPDPPAPSPAPGGGADGSTLSDEWEQHLATLLGPPPAAAPETRGDALQGASQDVQALSLAQPPPANSFPSASPLASGLLVADPAHGPLTALLAGASGAPRQAPPPLRGSRAGAAPPAPSPAPIRAEQGPAATASGTPTPFPAPEARTAAVPPDPATMSLVTLRGQQVLPWDIARPEGGAPKGLGDGILRGLGLAPPALPEEQMGALGYDLGRGLAALADLLVEFSQKEGAPSEQEGQQGADPFTTLPTGVQALSELIVARVRGRGSIEGAVRASIQRLRQRLETRNEQKRRLFESTLSALQERHALRTALAQLNPQRLAGNYGLGNSNRRRVKARAWDLFKANYPQIVELALARDRPSADERTDLAADAADAARALGAWPGRSR